MFCTVTGLRPLGVGKVLTQDRSYCTVEYFEGPGPQGRVQRRVERQKINRKVLGPNTRVYCQDSTDGRWSIGRILEDYEGASLVRFERSADKRIDHEDLFVRCRRPIADPTIFLAHGITETPQYAQSRTAFLRSYTKQRGAAWGISSLLSSSIELAPHQVDVVRRVLTDSSQRYLLADEVGLGKTIEAGVIIRQAVLDDPISHHVVVLVPESLVEQWRDELTERFGLRNYVDDSVVVLSRESQEDLLSALEKATVIVVDEAHHVADIHDPSAVTLYDALRPACARVDRLLLLSATPALRNERSFHRMLHLLDPTVHLLEDEQAFRAKVERRTVLAEAVAALDPQNALSLEPVVDIITQALPDDPYVQHLALRLRDELVGLPDPESPSLCAAIARLHTHLSETYRLHRRILRNRRKRVRFFTPERKGIEIWNVASDALVKAESCLEAWRLFALAQTDTDLPERELQKQFYWASVQALLEDPRRLKSLCRERLQACRSSSGETVLLEELDVAIDGSTALQSRIDVLATGLRQLISGTTKAVVFCASEEMADAVYKHLAVSFSSATLARHEVGNEERWRRFQSDERLKVILCGPLAEEGLNLQGGGKAVVHFDIPLTPNRIEQRIGRADRFGSGTPIRSIVLGDPTSPLQSGWLSVLERGLGVFGRSIASLQYLVDEAVGALPEDLFQNGAEAFLALADNLGGESGRVATELQLLDQQDALDELTPASERLLETIEEVEADWQSIQDSHLDWAVRCLMFDQVVVVQQGQTPTPDSSFCFQYRNPGAGGRATLIPLSDFLIDFLGSIDAESRGRSSERPRTYNYSSRRAAAVKRRHRVLRYGDSFVEALKAFSDVDDRGRSFAVWRQCPSLAESGIRMYFRFDFLTEARSDGILQALKDTGLDTKTARAAYRRRGDALLSPVVETVWLDEDGATPDDDFAAKFLDVPYVKSAGGAYIDKNMSSDLLHQRLSQDPDLVYGWSERCIRMSAAARAVLTARASWLDHRNQAAAACRAESEARLNQRVARIRTLQGNEEQQARNQLVRETVLEAALLKGLLEPTVRLDVSGVVFLSKHSLGASSGTD